MTENNPPIYLAVMSDLKIDPEEQVLISHEDRFQSILNKNRSELL